MELQDAAPLDNVGKSSVSVVRSAARPGRTERHPGLARLELCAVGKPSSGRGTSCAMERSGEVLPDAALLPEKVVGIRLSRAVEYGHPATTIAPSRAPRHTALGAMRRAARGRRRPLPTLALE